MSKYLLIVTVVLAFLPSSARTADAQAVTAVPALDLTRFAGTWYEIARLPDKAEKHCVRDAVVLYALADKPHRLQVVNSCVTRDGSTEIRNASARTANKKVADGRLKVSSTFPFSTKQWVLYVDEAYRWAIVGSPNHKLVWILSRTPQLPSEKLADLDGRVSAEGFSTAKLLPVTQPATTVKELPENAKSRQ